MKEVTSVKSRPVKVAVAGNPNSGKSTLINAVAGSRLQVGNWSGVTVEKKEANFLYQNKNIQLVDLPGSYSLSPYTQEEVIARDFLINEKPDLIINVVDATNLERNFYLTVQLLELGIPVIVALNIYDETKKKGYKIDIEKIEKSLGIKVIPTIATQKAGIDNLLDAVAEIAESPANYKPQELKYSPQLESSISELEQKIAEHRSPITRKYNSRWIALKLLEKDSKVSTKIEIDELDKIIERNIDIEDNDLESLLADERYAVANGLIKDALTKPKIERIDLTERIDKVALSKFFGIPLFLLAMWVVFKLTFDIANPFVDFIDTTINGPLNAWVTAGLSAINSPEWFVSLLTEGVIAGVGFVLTFVPLIFTMMFFITFLEGSGYMARAAFVMDRAMNAIGLHGKSFIPLLLGFGCNVPAVYATRTLETKRDKILTSMIIPFMSCGARLPVYIVFISIFFHNYGGTVLLGLYVLGIAIAVISGLLLKKTMFKGETPMFIMELPPYRLPKMKSLMIHTWEKGKHFLTKAGTYILAVSIFVWFLLNLPWGVEDKKDSILGQTGQVIAPVMEPLGFGNWEASSALLTGVIAKEIVIGTMAEIYVNEMPEETSELSFTEDVKSIGTNLGTAFYNAGSNVVSTFGVATLSIEGMGAQKSLKNVILKNYTPLTALAFMTFVLLYMPCVITGIAMRQEFGTWKWYAISLFNGFAAAWIVSFAVFQVGSFLGIGV